MKQIPLRFTLPLIFMDDTKSTDDATIQMLNIPDFDLKERLDLLIAVCANFAVTFFQPAISLLSSDLFIPSNLIKLLSQGSQDLVSAPLIVLL